MLKKIEVTRELHEASAGAPEGCVYQGDCTLLMPELLETYAGRVKCIYMDPPFMTGDRFDMRVRIGEKEWKSGNGTLTLEAYQDTNQRDVYLGVLRSALLGARALLRDDGMIFVHIDYRAHPYIRLLMDEIFGESNFLNEIVWVYQTGGRARKYFSRKHDIILFYRKSVKYDFDIDAVAVSRAENRHNHMKRHIDDDGRVYRSIRSGGKVYTYYDDSPTPPSDVWDDVSHLQQKDPQRTGYDTQKPLKLLERIVLCSTKPGETVLDLFMGSGTTLEAACLNGRNFVGVDQSALAIQAVRRRISAAHTTYEMRPAEGAPTCEARCMPGIAFHRVSLDAFSIEPGVCARVLGGMDAVDSWAAGYLAAGEMHVYAEEFRTKQHPRLSGQLEIPMQDGHPVIRVSDVLGRNFFYLLPIEMTGLSSESNTERL